MSWEQLDFRIFKQQEPFTIETVGAVERSVAVVQFPAVPGSQLWRVEEIQVGVQTATAQFWPGVTAQVFDQTPNVLYLAVLAPYADTGYQQVVPVCDVLAVDTTLSGNGDQSEYSPPITVLQGNSLTVVFVAPFPPIAGVPTVAMVRAQVSILGGIAGGSTPVAGSQAAPAISAAL